MSENSFEKKLNQVTSADRNDLRDDLNGIREAQSFFCSMGITVESDGFITNRLTPEQITQLKEWHKSTTQNSIQMPFERDFYRKVLLAVSLWRQMEGPKINYLLGKGIGVEVALRGVVNNRNKRPIKFPYRPHSDFELYAVDYNYNPSQGYEDLGGKPVYTEEFVRVFGKQEYFPPTITKGLTNIPPDLLYTTAETVNFGGIPVLIPELEILFLDKLMTKESTPRKEGFDAELLAKQYVLDRAKVHRYLDEFVINPGVSEIEENFGKIIQRQLEGIKRNIEWFREESKREGVGLGTSDLIKKLNKEMEESLKILGHENRWECEFSGIRLNLWEPLKPEQVDKEGNIIDPGYLQRLEERVRKRTSNAIIRYKGLHQVIEKLFGDIGRGFPFE